MHFWDSQKLQIPPLLKGDVKPRVKRRGRNAAFRRLGNAPIRGKGEHKTIGRDGFKK